MPEIPVEIAEQLPEPKENETYTIQEVETFTSQVRAYKGLRVKMVTAQNEVAVSALWLRQVAGKKSKLGAFVTALGNNTDNWVNRRIRIVAWRDKNREIQLVT
jgi:hypothetical protein